MNMSSLSQTITEEEHANPVDLLFAIDGDNNEDKVKSRTFVIDCYRLCQKVFIDQGQARHMGFLRVLWFPPLLQFNGSASKIKLK